MYAGTATGTSVPIDIGMLPVLHLPRACSIHTMFRQAFGSQGSSSVLLGKKLRYLCGLEQRVVGKSSIVQWVSVPQKDCDVNPNKKLGLQWTPGRSTGIFLYL